jgi:hypothetical protein
MTRQYVGIVALSKLSESPYRGMSQSSRTMGSGMTDRYRSSIVSVIHHQSYLHSLMMIYLDLGHHRTISETPSGEMSTRYRVTEVTRPLASPELLIQQLCLMYQSNQIEDRNEISFQSKYTIIAETRLWSHEASWFWSCDHKRGLRKGRIVGLLGEKDST